MGRKPLTFNGRAIKHRSGKRWLRRSEVSIRIQDVAIAQHFECNAFGGTARAPMIAIGSLFCTDWPTCTSARVVAVAVRYPVGCDPTTLP
jgi:hypothetical protein